MPRALNNVRWEEWKFCDRCGFLHPISMLRKQKGLLLCSCHQCTDNLDVERRGQMISKVLGTPDQKPGIAEINKAPGEVVF